MSAPAPAANPWQGMIDAQLLARAAWALRQTGRSRSGGDRYAAARAVFGSAMAELERRTVVRMLAEAARQDRAAPGGARR